MEKDKKDIQENQIELSTVERELLKHNPKIFEGVSQKEKSKIIKTLVSISLQKSHSGPLPDSQTLEEYNRIIPNGADRIMIVFEKQSEHRMTIEKKVIGGQMFQSNLGQIFALVIGLFSLSCATYVILEGHEWAGSIIGVGGITGLVTAFIKGKSNQEKSLLEKNPRQK